MPFCSLKPMIILPRYARDKRIRGTTENERRYLQVAAHPSSLPAAPMASLVNNLGDYYNSTHTFTQSTHVHHGDTCDSLVMVSTGDEHLLP